MERTTRFQLVLGFLSVFLPPSNTKEYDAIVVGAGGGGCPLAQTLAEGGKKVLLLERGPERPSVTETKFTLAQALRESRCVETFSSGGVQVSTGKCMGGATSFNQGIWIEEEPEWVKTQMEKILGEEFHDLDMIADAFEWVTERVAPEPTQEDAGGADRLSAMVQAMQNVAGFDVVNTQEGQPRIPTNGGIWRTHSIFEAQTGRRRSADTILDRDNPNLTIRTNSEVEKVVFDVDSIPLWSWLFAFGRKPIAQCVKLVSGENVCVREGGKIFLSAGVFHTPHLLHKSGIGPLLGKVVNTEIGNNLSDKPAIPLIGFFERDFDYSGQVICSHVAATDKRRGSRSQIDKTILFEELSFGVPALFDGVAYERNFAPSLLRSTFIADDIVDRLDQCSAEVLGNGANGVSDFCEVFEPVVAANCHASFTLLGALVADPSSSGRILLGWGDPKVHVNYLSTTEDVEALGAAIRTAFDIMTTTPTGASQLQPPCSSKEDTSCQSSSCPDLMKEFETELGGLAGMVLPSYPVSTIYPFSVEAQTASLASDYDLGNALRFSIISPHHLAGTARVGSVLDRNFQVLGLENLYVADASALPKTPRVNSMATAMMVGRLVGVIALNQGNW